MWYGFWRGCLPGVVTTHGSMVLVCPCHSHGGWQLSRRVYVRDSPETDPAVCVGNIFISPSVIPAACAPCSHSKGAGSSALAAMMCVPHASCSNRPAGWVGVRL